MDLSYRKAHVAQQDDHITLKELELRKAGLDATLPEPQVRRAEKRLRFPRYRIPHTADKWNLTHPSSIKAIARLATQGLSTNSCRRNSDQLGILEAQAEADETIQCCHTLSNIHSSTLTHARAVNGPQSDFAVSTLQRLIQTGVPHATQCFV